MSHNSKAIYQRYMGWYDANPANLNPLPPEPPRTHYVEAMGGAGRGARQGRRGHRRRRVSLGGDAAEPRRLRRPENDKAAREQLAGVYTQLGYRKPKPVRGATSI